MGHDKAEKTGWSGVTRRSVNRVPRPFDGIRIFEPMLVTQVPRQSKRPTCGSTLTRQSTHDSHAGLNIGSDWRRHLPAGPSIGLGARRAEASYARWNRSIMCGCFRALSAPRARSHRDKSARGATNPVCVLWEPHRRAKTSASRSIGRTSPPFAQVGDRVVVLITLTTTTTRTMVCET